MPTVKKQEMVAELTTLLEGSPSAIVTDYRGLTVADIAAVRRALREHGITYRVIKNRLARIAAREAGLAELDPLLEGPSALAVGHVDEIVLARSFLEAVRPYRTVTIRGGLLRGRRIESAAVDRLATLPGRDVLLGQLAGSMVSPLSSMASLLAAPLRNLGYALQQLATQKAAADGGAPAAAAAPAVAAPEAVASPEALAESAPNESAPEAAPDGASRPKPSRPGKASADADKAPADSAPAPSAPAPSAPAPSAPAPTSGPDPTAEAQPAATSEAEAAPTSEPTDTPAPESQSDTPAPESHTEQA
jgi:large subunit ribosomal protein L10